MSDLQTGLALLGTALIAGIFVVSRIREFRGRRLAEQVLPESDTDVLLDGKGATTPVRSEPAFGKTRSELLPLSEDASANPAVEFAVILRGDKPVSAADLWQALIASTITTRGIRWAGLEDDGGRWFVIQGPSDHRFDALAAMLQLSNRSGPVNETRLTLFADEMRALAQQLGLNARQGDIPAALTAAVALDQFCAQVDVLIGMNVMFPEGGEPTMQAIRRVAEAEGLSLGEDGVFHARDDQQRERFTLAHRDAAPFLDIDVDTSLVSGVTFLLDVPRASDGIAALRDMFSMAERVAGALGGRVVDDNSTAIGTRQLAAIERQLTGILQQMDMQGISAGSALAQRLFSR
ncbi:MAG: hypothetical protein KGK17_08120 [Betaproteobacteria bacterium]|nr:hypothetical protein [Betaproteobacteria bacterium]